MSEDKKVKKVIFEPGCFDHLEFENQEELDALVAQVTEMLEGMSEDELMANSQPIDLEQLAQDDPELAQALAKQLTATQGRTLQ